MVAVLVQQWGDPSVLEAREVEVPLVRPLEALVRVEYAGVNYVDVYHRSGMYPKEPPFIPGGEACGVVEEVGAEVTSGIAVGDRVAFAMGAAAYAEYVAVPAWKLVPVPDDIGSDMAAALMLQGMTAHFLSHDCYPIAEGDTVLVHAAAGGVGLLLTQLVKLRGGRVIGTTSTEEKTALARKAGADEVIGYEGFDGRVREITDGEGAAVVYDGVGRTTFDAGLKALRPAGSMILYGAASGQPEPLTLQSLAAHGSLYVQRPTVKTYVRTADMLQQRARRVLDLVSTGKLEIRIGARYPLGEARRAHEDLESRRTTGKLLLTP